MRVMIVYMYVCMCVFAIEYTHYYNNSIRKAYI